MSSTPVASRSVRMLTVLMIAHRLTTLRNCDWIYRIDKGQIVQRGTHDTLVNQPGIYQQIYDLQARIENELEEEIASV